MNRNWVVYVVESVAGGQSLWLFWSAQVQDWVSDLDRASRYTGDDAEAVSDRLREEEEVGCDIIRAGPVRGRRGRVRG